MPVMPRRTGLRLITFTGKPGQRWAIMPTPSALSPQLFNWRRVGPRPGSIMASRATGRGTSKTPRLAMRQALLSAPGHPAATANLGAFLRITGEAEAGEALLRDSLARAPENAGARLNLAAELLQEERPADALALLDAAPALPEEKAALRHWHLQRALALLQLGRPAEARPVLAALAALGPIPPELAPLWHWRLVLLALSERNPAVSRLPRFNPAVSTGAPPATPPSPPAFAAAARRRRRTASPARAPDRRAGSASPAAAPPSPPPVPAPP